MKKSIALASVVIALGGVSAFAETKFQPMPHSTTVVVSEGTTQDQVDATVRANNAAGKASYEAVAKAGGCNADIVPTTITAYCWAHGEDANPTGGPVGASQGGSE